MMDDVKTQAESVDFEELEEAVKNAPPLTAAVEEDPEDQLESLGSPMSEALLKRKRQKDQTAKGNQGFTLQDEECDIGASPKL